jgi:hypothetical protein
MAACELSDFCIFFNGQTTDMPHTKEYLKSLYCKGDLFTECDIYRISEIYGIDKVPKYFYPINMYDNMDLNLIDPNGGFDMLIKVLYTGGTLGKVKSSTLNNVMKSGEIIAFHCSEGWVDVRRKSKDTYSGVDRRRLDQEMFFAGFDS